MENKNSFHYSYSSREQNENDEILSKYGLRRSDIGRISHDELVRLDKKIIFPVTVAAVLIGIAGTLIFGTGLSMILAGGHFLFSKGIIVGVLGIAVMAAALPVSGYFSKRQRMKHASEIVNITSDNN